MKKIIASICSIVGVALFVGCAGTKDSSLLPTGEDSSEKPDRVSNSVVSSSSADEASFFNSSSLPSSKVPDYLPTISQAQEDRERILSMENNSQSYQSLIHNTVDFVDLVEHNFYRMYLPSYSYNPSIESMDYYFPIECIRDMGDDRKYVIYRSEEGCLFYLFFRDEMAFYSHGVCISHARIKADFDTIQMGSTFSEVKAIDSDAKYWESESGLKASWSSYHLLKDGILVITYDDNQTVTGIDYSPDFVYKKAFGTNEEKMTVEYDYSILPQDYPA